MMLYDVDESDPFMVNCRWGKIIPYRWLSNKRWYKKKGFFEIQSKFL